MPNKITKKCCKCGKRAKSPRSFYCESCAHLRDRMLSEHMHHEAVESVWEYIGKYGKKCFYTKIDLELKNTRSPWYLVFDHWIPNDNRRVVITAALINEMKSDLTEDEFWYYVTQLAEHMLYHADVRKKKLSYWYRLIEPDFFGPQGFQGKNIRIKKKCCKCGKQAMSERSMYCVTCGHIRSRMAKAHFSKETKEAVWEYIRENGYRCYFTKMSLDTVDHRSPWYLVFEYLVPHEHTKVVITSALFNVMKSDLTEKEFWYIIIQLYNYKIKHENFRKKKLTHWYR
jgi:ribosomal protein L37E